MKKLCLLVYSLLLCWPLSSLAQNQTLFFGEDDVLISIATFQEELYLLTYEGVFCYDIESATPALVTDAVTGDYRNTHCADWLCATDNALYAVQYADKVLLQIMDDTGVVNVQPVMQLEQTEESFVLDAAMTDRFFCLLEQTNTGVQLSWVDLESNAHSTQKLDGSFAITTYGNDIAYAAKTTKRGVMSYTVAIIDLTTGNVTELFASSVPIENLCASENDLYIISKNKLCSWQPGSQEPVASAALPSGDLVACVAFARQVAVVVDNSLAIRSLDNAAEQTTLHIAQTTGRSADYQAFLMTHPEIDLAFVGSTDAEEQFIQDILTQTGTIDIYQMTDISILQSIAGKSMAKDLAISPIIASTVQDMYPPYASVFSTDGSIWAVPSTCYLAVPGYNEAFFVQFEIPIPTTVMELLEVTELWLAYYADEHPEAQFDPFSNGLTLDAILRQYEVEKELQGDRLTFQNDDLANVIEKYLKLEKQFQQQSYTYQIEITAFNTLDLPHSAEYKPMILPIQKDAQAAISNAYIDVTFYVVNPYSEHVNEAVAFLESVCTSWDDATKALLLQSCDQAIEASDYQMNYTSLKAQIQNIEETNYSNESLQAELEHLQQELEILNRNRWIVTEEEMTFYKALTDYMIFKTDDPLDELYDQLLTSYKQLQEGRISIASFLQILDSKVQMVLLEMGI